jgi:hypothetical protein
VIEHFRDPVRMVSRIKEWLVPGGLIWAETPDIDSGGARRAGNHWMHIKVPEHLSSGFDSDLQYLQARHAWGSALLRSFLIGTLANVLVGLGGAGLGRMWLER